MQTLPADRGLTPSAGMSQLLLFRPVSSPADVAIHAVSIPSRNFTGDFFYTHRHGQHLWFALGDVAGKGLNAAVVMAMIQEELEQRIGSCAMTACDPSATTQRLHEFLRTVLPSNKFATAVIGHLHDDGTLTITNAGHCPPVILRRDGSMQEIASTGPVAGILPVAQWHSVRVALARGESVILYSDGLMEARSSSGEEFGTAGVRESLLDVKRPTARQIGDRIMDAVNAHSGSKREDDLTLVVLQR